VQLSDGAPELANLLGAHLNVETVGRDPFRLVDFWHVLEKLGDAARVLAGPESAQLLASWKMKLVNRNEAAEEILAALRRSRRRQLRVEGKRPVHDAIRYLENHGDRMHYAQARARGLPIGSGNVEATCKSLVAMRMKRPGSRWREDTGERILHLRALALSDRWARAIQLTFHGLRLAVRSAA